MVSYCYRPCGRFFVSIKSLLLENISCVHKNMYPENFVISPKTLFLVDHYGP